jgi:tetratricopeptide (TPR) repeat protein
MKIAKLLLIIVLFSGCHQMVGISNLDQATCAKNFQDRLKRVLVRFGEKPEVAERLARSEYNWLLSSNLQARPFLVQSPSGNDYTFFISKEKNYCKMHLVEKSRGFTSLSSNIPPYLASRKLVDCSCEEKLEEEDELLEYNQNLESLKNQKNLQASTSNELLGVATYKNIYDSGMALYNAGNYESAISIFNEAIKVNNERTEGYLWRGNSYFMLEKYDMAILDFDIVLQRDADNVTAINNRGSSYYSIGWDMKDDIKARPYYEKALIDFNKTLLLNPGMIDTIYNRAACIRRLGNTEEACREWQRAIQMGQKDSKSAYYDFCK